jgi:hypothetical protein
MEEAPSVAKIRRSGRVAWAWLVLVFGAMIGGCVTGFFWIEFPEAPLLAIIEGVLFWALWGWHWTSAIRKDNEMCLQRIGPRGVIPGGARRADARKQDGGG